MSLYLSSKPVNEVCTSNQNSANDQKDPISRTSSGFLDLVGVIHFEFRILFWERFFFPFQRHAHTDRHTDIETGTNRETGT